MKLVMCNKCGDLFNLQRREKSCTCGEVRGRYHSDGSHARVYGDHTAIAMGSGSLLAAMRSIPLDNESDWRYDGRSSKVLNLFEQMKEIVPTLIICWAREPSGPTNSHTAATNGDVT